MSDAGTWVGERKPEDGLGLDLEAIRRTLPVEAAALREILNDPRIAGLLTVRREASEAATKAQKRFKGASAAAVVGTAIATLASGLLLYGAGSEGAAAAQTPPIQPSLVQWAAGHHVVITGLQIAGLFTTAVASGLLGSQDYVAQWAENRRRAEVQRREVFNKVLELAAKTGPTPLAKPDPGNAVRQALEFFRRYQLQLQIAFYGRSGARHGSAAGLLAWTTALLAGVAAVSGIVGGLGGTAVVLSAFLGIAVPILLSAAQSWRAVTRDTDKATAYAKARQALQAIEFELTDVRGKANLADTAAVQAYIDRVHLVMAEENEAWVPAAPSGSAALPT